MGRRRVRSLKFNRFSRASEDIEVVWWCLVAFWAPFGVPKVPTEPRDQKAIFAKKPDSLGDRPSPHQSHGWGSLGNPTRELPGSSNDQDVDPSWAVLPGRNKASNWEVGDGTLPRPQAHQQPLGDFSGNITEVR